MIPELEPHCGSWIVTSKTSGGVYETFERRMAEVFDKHGYTVETAAQYLSRINKEIKS